MMMLAVLLQSPGRHRVPLQEGFSHKWTYQQCIKKKLNILPTQFMLLLFWGTMKREVWLYYKPWAFHFILFMFLEIHLSYGHFLHFVALFLVTKYYFFRSHRPTAKRGTSITVAASNSMIFAIRSASDLIHRKRLLRGCFLLLLQGFRAACHCYFFLAVQIVSESQ